jgi:hypothetical protein
MSSDFPKFDAIRQAELNFILNRGPAAAGDEPPLWGLALSGGGIRSATFSLGVLQVLARNKLLGAFHYISTISGGGYAGAFLQALIRRRGFAGAYKVLQSSVEDVADDESANGSIDAQRPIRHLRAYSNYLSPRKTAVSGDTLGLLGTYVRNLLLVQTQLFTCATTVYGPLLLRYGLWFAQSSWLAVGWVGVFGWILSTGSGIFAAYSQRATGDPKSSSMKLEAIARIAPWIFLVGLAIGVSFAGQQILAAAGWDAQPSLNGVKPEDIASTYLANISRGTLLHYGTLLFVAVLALVLWLTFGYAIDLNEFSLNAFYRNRLVRCYLGASNANRNPEATTDFDPHDDIVLADIAQQERDADGNRPLFPIVGTALNLVHTRQLDWQDRKAASFFFTPGYCGYVPPPSHPEAHAVGDTDAAIGATSGCLPARKQDATAAPNPNPLSAALTMGDVMAISGAAVSPNMGYHSSPAVTLLLTVFDARLGWWLPNPGIRNNSAANVPRFSGWWLITEMLGLTNETGRLIYVSDGGHFDNLGIYELVRRRCRLILAVDAGADPDRDFADLGDVIQKCRIDFGIDIRIDTSKLRVAADGNSQSCFAVGTIEYPGGDAGTLLYLKPSLVGKEPSRGDHETNVRIARTLCVCFSLAMPVIALAISIAHGMQSRRPPTSTTCAPKRSWTRSTPMAITSSAWKKAKSFHQSVRYARSEQGRKAR